MTLCPVCCSNFGTSSAITGCTPEPDNILSSAAEVTEDAASNSAREVAAIVGAAVLRIMALAPAALEMLRDHSISGHLLRDAPSVHFRVLSHTRPARPAVTHNNRWPLPPTPSSPSPPAAGRRR